MKLRSRRISHFDQSHRAFQLNRARLATILVTTVLGALGGVIGLFVGFFVGVIYVYIAGLAAGHFSLDLHDGKVLDSLRAPETYKVTEELALLLGIEAPAIYRIEIDRPQMCVCATGYGRKVRGRIGVSRALLQEASEEQLHLLLVIAVARIWCGEASFQSSAAALAGLPLQMARATGVNGSASSGSADYECGLSQFGKLLLTLFAPYARMVLTLSGAGTSVIRGDCAALRLGSKSFSASSLESALRWLYDQQLPVVRDPIVDYNPAEAALYLITPFEMDFENASKQIEIPFWKRSRFLITSVIPHLQARLEAMKRREAERPPVPESAADEAPLSAPSPATAGRISDSEPAWSPAAGLRQD